MEDQKFKIGDVVHHKSNFDIKMVVTKWCGLNTYPYACRWIDKNGELQDKRFKEEELYMSTLTSL